MNTKEGLVELIDSIDLEVEGFFTSFFYPLRRGHYVAQDARNKTRWKLNDQTSKGSPERLVELLAEKVGETEEVGWCHNGERDFPSYEDAVLKKKPAQANAFINEYPSDWEATYDVNNNNMKVPLHKTARIQYLKIVRELGPVDIYETLNYNESEETIRRIVNQYYPWKRSSELTVLSSGCEDLLDLQFHQPKRGDLMLWMDNTHSNSLKVIREEKRYFPVVANNYLTIFNSFWEGGVSETVSLTPNDSRKYFPRKYSQKNLFRSSIQPLVLSGISIIVDSVVPRFNLFRAVCPDLYGSGCYTTNPYLFNCRLPVNQEWIVGKKKILGFLDTPSLRPYVPFIEKMNAT